jgi:hypothetical protein
MELDVDSMMTDDVLVSTMRVPNDQVDEALEIIAEESNGNLDVELTPVGNNFTVITIIEIIGAGQSQEVDPPQ